MTPQLPREIRLRILEYALTPLTPIKKEGQPYPYKDYALQLLCPTSNLHGLRCRALKEDICHTITSYVLPILRFDIEEIRRVATVLLVTRRCSENGFYYDEIFLHEINVRKTVEMLEASTRAS